MLLVVVCMPDLDHTRTHTPHRTGGANQEVSNAQLPLIGFLMDRAKRP